MPQSRHIIALKSDNSVWAWGLGTSTQIGDSFAITKSSPVSVVGNQSFYLIALGSANSFGVNVGDGSVWSWGIGTSGQLGTNSVSSNTIPMPSLAYPIFKALSAGSNFVGGLRVQDGSAWMWGVGTTGQLGQNTVAVNRSSPVSVVGDHSFDKISLGDIHVLSLKSDGTCWAWGDGNVGQLGEGSSALDRSSPVSVIGAHSFLDVQAGNAFSMGLKNDGSLWGWGASSSGQLGQNTTNVARSSPVSVVGNHSFDQISVGQSHVIGLKFNNGSAWAWGLATVGQAGDLSNISRSSPVSVVGAHSFQKILATVSNSYGLKADGTLWAWGDRLNGAIGDNIADFTVSPVQVVGSHNFYFLSTNYTHNMALKLADGAVWGWGTGSSGELGEATVAVNRSSPVSVVGNHSFTRVACGGSFNVAVKANDGSCWAWGLGATGQLGQGSSAVSRSSPVSVVGAHSFDKISCGVSHTVAIKSNNGTAWMWGGNSNGQLGDSSTTTRSSPVSVVGAHSFGNISAGSFHASGLKSDNGTAWCWGQNNSGQLGDGSATNRSSPVSVVGDHSFDKISAGNTFTLALKGNDGSCWAWGLGTSGQLAQGSSAVARSSPVSVVGNHSFDKIAISGGSHALALKANDGSAWSWGFGTSGQLGDGSIITKSSPVSVVGGHSFIDISIDSISSFGLKANGEVWSWGSRLNGQLGDNYSEIATSPMQVVGSHAFVNIATDNIHGINKDYTKQNILEVTLPTTNSELNQGFDDQDYVDVSLDDNIYVGVDGRPGSKYLNFLFQQRKPGNSTFNVTWRGKSRIACSAFTVLLQVYNVNSGLWETLASNNSTAANTEFELTGSVLVNASNYYDAFSRVTFRIYQQQESLSSSSSSSSSKSSSSSSCSSSCSSSSSSSSNNPCWIAAVIFGGWYAPKTIDARYFMNNVAPKWMKNFYIKVGSDIAAYIADKSILKMILKPIFELFAFIGRLLRPSEGE